MIVFLTKDLMIQSKASAAATGSGATIKSVGSIASAIETIKSNNVISLLVDLQTPGLSVDELIGQLKQLNEPPKTIAFAQHVQEELLAAAKDDVIETVLTRGQFSNRLPQIIQEIMSACDSGSHN